MIARIGAVVALAAALLASCSASGNGTPAPTTTSTTRVVESPSPMPSAPIDTGPTTAATATSCPYTSTEFVHQTAGMRLDRIAVLNSGGHVVGCRFYPLSHPTAQCDASCLRGEHLPGPNQPVVEITTQRYTSAAAAHNAFVRTALRGSNPQQVALGGGVTGVCFQTDFYARDHGTDYACAVSKGKAVLLVRTVDTTSAYSTKIITAAVLPKVR